MSAKPWIASAVISGVALAIYTTAGQGGGGIGGILPASVASASGAGGGSGSQQQWARDFLSALGEPDTACNQNAIVDWQRAEGGGPGGDGATYNDLNTTLREPGSYAMNSAGVQVFTSYQQGLDANAAVAEEAPYAGIRSALAAGNNAQAVADAVANSPWGTAPFSASC